MSVKLIKMALGGDVLRLDTATINDFAIGADGQASFRIDADGGVYYARLNVSGGAFIKQYDWVIPNSSASKYIVRWTAGTGTVDITPGAADTDLALTSDRTWEEFNGAGLGSEQATFTARIRLASTSEDLKTATITLSVDAEP